MGESGMIPEQFTRFLRRYLAQRAISEARETPVRYESPSSRGYGACVKKKAADGIAAKRNPSLNSD